MRLLWYPGWLLRCCYAVARVLGVVARVPGVVAKLCYGVARVLGVVARVPEVLPGVAMRLLWYLGWLLGCC